MFKIYCIISKKLAFVWTPVLLSEHFCCDISHPGLLISQSLGTTILHNTWARLLWIPHRCDILFFPHLDSINYTTSSRLIRFVANDRVRLSLSWPAFLCSSALLLFASAGGYLGLLCSLAIVNKAVVKIGMWPSLQVIWEMVQWLKQLPGKYFWFAEFT